MRVFFAEETGAAAFGKVALDDTDQPSTLQRARTVRDYWVMVRVT